MTTKNRNFKNLPVSVIIFQTVSERFRKTGYPPSSAFNQLDISVLSKKQFEKVCPEIDMKK